MALLGIVGAGLWPRLNKQKELVAQAKTESERRPLVRVARVQRAPGRAELELPADLQALIESPIYARVEGYIAKRHVDIGWKVRKNQPLADLETPELDQQLMQARAALSQARASVKQLQAREAEAAAALKLAQITADRWRRLAAEGVSSRQEADERVASLEVKQAETEATRANVLAAQEAMAAAEAGLRRLEQLKSFSRLTAPFDGIITYRHPDVGTLISPGAAQRDMFRVADISTIRVFVNVPQAYVTQIKPGVPARLTIDDLPGRAWEVQVGGIANALDINTRTMLAVIRLKNTDNLLMPGMSSRVRFSLPNPPSALQVPADALVTRNEGVFVAAVDANRLVHFRKIDVARDNGDRVEIHEGLREGELLVLNPNDEIRENTAVEIKTEAKPANPAPAPPGKEK
jgi:RND family efflux transporter MFP subunit